MPRPRKTALERIRTQVWAEQLLIEARVTTGYELEEIVYPERMKRNDNGSIRSCAFDKYLRGDHRPKDETLRLVDEIIPGAINRWRSPIWDVFLGKRINRDQIIQGLSRISPLSAQALVERVSDDRLDLQPITSSLIDLMKNDSSYDTFEIIIMVSALAAEIRDHSLWAEANSIYRQQRRNFVYEPIFRRLHKNLFPHADKVCRPEWITSRGQAIVIDWPWTADRLQLEAWSVNFSMWDMKQQRVPIHIIPWHGQA